MSKLAVHSLHACVDSFEAVDLMLLLRSALLVASRTSSSCALVRFANHWSDLGEIQSATHCHVCSGRSVSFNALCRFIRSFASICNRLDVAHVGTFQ